MQHSSNSKECSGLEFVSHSIEVFILRGETRERWQRLCEQAADEQDPEVLLKLIQEIDQLLSEKEERLKRQELTKRTTP